PPPHPPPPFPYTTLFRSSRNTPRVDRRGRPTAAGPADRRGDGGARLPGPGGSLGVTAPGAGGGVPLRRHPRGPGGSDRACVGPEDRKSTRLNSSHVKISY